MSDSQKNADVPKPSNGGGGETASNQEEHTPIENSVGGTNKRLRQENENNDDELDGALSYAELKEKIVAYKKRAEVAEALLEERNNELQENLNELISVSEDLIKVKKDYMAASGEIANLKKEYKALAEGNIAADAVMSKNQDLAQVDQAAARKEKLRSLREARNNVNNDHAVQIKDGTEGGPKTSTPNHAHNVVLNIRYQNSNDESKDNNYYPSCDSDKKLEKVETSGTSNHSADGSSGSGTSERWIKRVNIPCARDPCPFGPANCKFLHFSEGKPQSLNLEINNAELHNYRAKEGSYRSKRSDHQEKQPRERWSRGRSRSTWTWTSG